MRYEFIKLFRQIHVKAIFFAVIFLSAMLGVVSVGAFRSRKDSDSNTYLKGTAGFANERKKYETVSGEITTEKFNEALQYIQSFSNEWSAIVNGKELYPGILYILQNAYAALDGHFTLFEIADADDIYEQNKEQIQLRIKDKDLQISDQEMKNMLAWAAKIHKPYVNELAEPWNRFYKALQFVLLLNLLTVMIYASNLYSCEKTQRMDLIIGTMEQRAIHKIVTGKATSLACLSGGQYLISTASLCTVYFGISGPIAWKSQVQTWYYTSILPMSYQEVFYLSLISGFFACLAAAFFAAALNAKLMKPMPALITGVAVTFVPLLLRNFTMLPNSVMKLIQAFPVNAALVSNNITSLYLYPFPGNGMPAVYVIPAVSVLLAAAGIWLSMHSAKKYMCMD